MGEVWAVGSIHQGVKIIAGIFGHVAMPDQHYARSKPAYVFSRLSSTASCRGSVAKADVLLADSRRDDTYPAIAAGRKRSSTEDDETTMDMIIDVGPIVYADEFVDDEFLGKAQESTQTNEIQNLRLHSSQMPNATFEAPGRCDQSGTRFIAKAPNSTSELLLAFESLKRGSKFY